MSLGQIIRKKREQLHLTLDEVSNRIGFSKPYLSTIETGKVKNPPSDELLTKLEKILEFDSGLLLHIAHIEGLPADVRQEYESAEAENQKWRHIAKNLIDQKADSNRLTELLAESDLNVEQEKLPLAPGRLVPVINKVSAGYPTDFNDLDYPVGIADDYIRCPDLHDPNTFAVRV
ncbi:MAG: helix-turn-helix domain-containing protein, partial [Planctomycetota bacterium]